MTSLRNKLSFKWKALGSSSKFATTVILRHTLHYNVYKYVVFFSITIRCSGKVASLTPKNTQALHPRDQNRLDYQQTGPEKPAQIAPKKGNKTVLYYYFFECTLQDSL